MGVRVRRLRFEATRDLVGRPPPQVLAVDHFFADLAGRVVERAEAVPGRGRAARAAHRRAAVALCALTFARGRLRSTWHRRWYAAGSPN